MLRYFSKNGRIWILLLCFIQIMVNAQVISVDLSSIPDSSMVPTSKTNSNILPQSVTEVKSVDLYSYIVNTTSNQGYNDNISDKSTIDNNLAAQNPYDQFIVPANETWSSFGNLTLDVLASNEFYVNSQKNTSSNVKRNNTNQENKTSLIFNTTRNVVPNVINNIIDNQIPVSSNTMMTQNQLNFFQSQLTQVQQKASNTISNTIVPPKITNFQFSPVIYAKKAQNTPNSGSNITPNPSPAFDFTSNSVYTQTTDNNVIIQGLSDTINARFNSFFGS